MKNIVDLRHLDTKLTEKTRELHAALILKYLEPLVKEYVEKYENGNMPRDIQEFVEWLMFIKLGEQPKEEPKEELDENSVPF